MANIRKTFNFRNGIQVDEDNLLVNSLGLVGIGTTVPTELLDVRGTAKIVGLVTTNELFANNGELGVATIATLRAGTNILLNSGIITSTSGVVTFYGDGGGLINIPTSQWIDVDSGLGYTSIYASGFVGVSTTFPYFPFQVGGAGNLSNFSVGVGINSRGDILATGIITASSFIGSGAGVTSINAANVTTGTISNDRLPVLTNNKLPSNIDVTGIITAQTHFKGNLVGIASTALNVDSAATLNLVGLNVGFLTTSTLTSGIATVNTRLYSGGSIGIQTNNPQSNLHIVKTGISSIQLTGSTESILTFGRSLNQTQNTGGIRFGNTNGLFPYSNGSSFDVINYDTGSLNYYLHYGNPTGINTGNFNWIYGKDPTNPLMSLTYGGNLGIGITNPYNTLTVNGIGTFTSSLFVGSELNVLGSISATSLLIPSINSNFIGNLTGNVNATSGISTFSDVEIDQTLTAFKTFVSVSGTPDPATVFQVLDDGNAFIVSGSGIGIQTTTLLPGVQISGQEAGAIFKGVGIGTNALIRSAVDFADAGKNVSGGAGAFMIVPRLNTTQRGSLIPQNGAIIYNTSTSKFEGYVGSSWVDLGASSGIGAVVDDTSPQLGGNLDLNGKTINGTGNINITGISTLGNTVVGGATTQLIVTGDARVTGILTIGTSSITLDGSNNTINVGSGVTIDGSTGIIEATSLVVGGTTLTGTAVTFITAGSGISVDQNTGNVTITATGGGGGGESYWEKTDVGIHTLSNVGIGTTNPTSALTVSGDVNVSGVSTFSGNISLGSSAIFTSGKSAIFTASGRPQLSIFQSNSNNEAEIQHSSTGTAFNIRSTGAFADTNIWANNYFSLVASYTGSAQLNYQNFKKFETIGAGVTITGTTFTNQLSVSGVTTSQNGFTSGIGTAVQITTVGDQLIFTVPGVGSTSFTLY